MAIDPQGSHDSGDSSGETAEDRKRQVNPDRNYAVSFGGLGRVG
jgi:hypothetical protein